MRNTLIMLILLIFTSSLVTFAQEQQTPTSLPPVPTYGKISPIFECVYAKADGTFEAHFGYYNYNGETTEVPLGSANQIIPSSLNGLQPTTFLAGRQYDVFAVPFPSGSNIVWKLINKTATASIGYTTRCRPDTPVVTATLVSDSQIDLAWTPIDGAIGYTVFVSYPMPTSTNTASDTNTNTVDTSDPLIYETFNTAEPRFSHTGLACGIEYSYSVMALGVERNSIPSETVTVSTPACAIPAPAAPAAASITVDAGLNGLSVTVAPDANVDVYRLELFDGTNWVSMGTSADGQFNLSGLACGTSYTFRVAAVNASGEATSEPFTVTTDPCPPAMPNNLNVSVGLDSVTVTFAPEAGVTYRAEVWDGQAWVVAATSTDGTLVINNLSCGVTHTVRVVASNAGGETATPEMPIPMPICPPVAPTVTASATSMTDISIIWNAVENAAGYRVEMLQGGSWVVLSTQTETHYIASGLTCGTGYNFRVAAFNTSGEATSQTAYAETVVCPPAPLTDISVNVGGSGSNSASFVWTMQVNTTYRVELWNGSTWTTVANNAQGSFDMSNLACGTTYTFRIVATNASGEAYSQDITVTTAVCAPAAPVVTATANSTTDITLSWNAVQNADSYRIEMLQGGAWATLSTQAETTYAVGGLTCATSYSFRVTAINVSGEATSEIASAMTNACGPVQLLKNGSFESNLENWTLVKPSREGVRCPIKPLAYEGQCFFLFAGKGVERSRIVQNIDVNGLGIDSTTPLTFTAAIRANKMAKGFQLVTILFYTDGTKKAFASNLPRNTKGVYRVITRTYTPEKPVAKVRVIVRYISNSATGNARVDNLSLTYLPPAPTNAQPTVADSSVVPLPQAPQE